MAETILKFNGYVNSTYLKGITVSGDRICVANTLDKADFQIRYRDLKIYGVLNTNEFVNSGRNDDNKKIVSYSYDGNRVQVAVPDCICDLKKVLIFIDNHGNCILTECKNLKSKQIAELLKTIEKETGVMSVNRKNKINNPQKDVSILMFTLMVSACLAFSLAKLESIINPSHVFVHTSRLTITYSISAALIPLWVLGLYAIEVERKRGHNFNGDIDKLKKVNIIILVLTVILCLVCFVLSAFVFV